MIQILFPEAPHTPWWTGHGELLLREFYDNGEAPRAHNRRRRPDIG